MTYKYSIHLLKLSKFPRVALWLVSTKVSTLNQNIFFCINIDLIPTLTSAAEAIGYCINYQLQFTMFY